jgi:arylsulfatase A-like enzyme
MFLTLLLACHPAHADVRPNILFIAIDDLNDWVHHLGGHPQTKTPHIDRLAARGVTFTNAHCSAPVCNPSRVALCTGQRPSTTGIYDNNHDWREIIPQEITLPLYLKRQGYHVGGAGKIYHEAFRRESDWNEYAPFSRKEPKPSPGQSEGVGGIRFAPVDVNDDQMDDWNTVDWVVERLNRPYNTPFFLACGLYKPHMSWNVPRKYYDLYPLDKIVLPAVREDDLVDIPTAGVKMADPTGDHAAILKSGRWKEAVQAYLAACTFADSQAGRLIDALDRSPHRNNTIIILWGDHGWHLGEKQHWRKFTLWEESTRVPFIVIAPGVTKPNSICGRTVDSLSIFPTLADLCRLPIPASCEGVSLRPLLVDPTAVWDRPAVTTYGYQNHAVRTEKWRYIRYADGSEELYNKVDDPQEWINLATRPEMSEVKSDLALWLPTKNAITPQSRK